MLEVIQSTTFSKWLSGLKDLQARMRIHVRLDRVALDCSVVRYDAKASHKFMPLWRVC